MKMPSNKALQPTAAALGILIVTAIITSSARPRPSPAAVAELGR